MRHPIAHELLKHVDRQARVYGYYDVFSRFLDWCIYKMSFTTILPSDYDKIKPKDVKILDEMYNLYIQQDPYDDCLGDLYELIASKGHKSAMGQYFTPEGLSELIGQLVMWDPDVEQIDFCKPTDMVLQENVKVSAFKEPCCGSGKLILNACKEASRYKKFFSPAVAIDLDYTCVRMALINLCHAGVPAYLLHANYLSAECFRGFHIDWIMQYENGEYVHPDMVVPHLVTIMNLSKCDFYVAMGAWANQMNYKIVPKITKMVGAFYHENRLRYLGPSPAERKKMQLAKENEGRLFDISPAQEEYIKEKKKLNKKREKALKSDDRGGDQLSLF